MKVENTNTKNRMSRCVSIACTYAFVLDRRCRAAAHRRFTQKPLDFLADFRVPVRAQIGSHLQHQIQRRQRSTYRNKHETRQALAPIAIHRAPCRLAAGDQAESCARQSVTAGAQHKVLASDAAWTSQCCLEFLCLRQLERMGHLDQ